MAKIIAVYNMKGGVGKTTIATNLAYCSATHSSLRTLLWDIDAQGAASFLFDQERSSTKAKRLFSRQIEASALIEPTRWPGLDLLAADMSLRHLDQTLADVDKPNRLRKLLQKLTSDYERIILDCPPSLGEISDQIFRAVDMVVVPVVPTPLAMRSYRHVQEHLARNHERKPRLLPVISMVDRRKGLHRTFVAEHSDWPVIAQASIVERMAVEQSPVVAFAAGSPSSRAFSDLWLRIERTWTASPAPQP